MLAEIWNTVLYIPIFNILVFFYKLFSSNMGLAILAMTLFLKVATHPFTKSSLLISKKQKELQPEIDKLKKRYKDKQEFAKKQMELYKEHGINPVAGCLPQIIQIVVIIALYRVFTNILMGDGISVDEINNLLYNYSYLKFDPGSIINNKFLYLDLSKKDSLYILPVLAAVSQFIMSKYMMGASKTMEKVADDTPDKKDDIMYNVQQQMIYTMPIMTLIIGVSLPSGLVLYWFVSTLFTIGQYYLLNKNGSK